MRKNNNEERLLNQSRKVYNETKDNLRQKFTYLFILVETLIIYAS